MHNFCFQKGLHKGLLGILNARFSSSLSIDTTAAGGATIQTPGGSVIKLASLVKLAACYGKNLFSEVE